MADTSGPVLVYNRIDANRRNTLLLLAAFAALLLPFAYGFARLLPLAHGLARILTSSFQYGQALFPEVAGTEIVFLMTIALVASISAAGFAYVGSPLISSFLLWRADAQRTYRDREPDLFRTVENLCIGAGLPPPTLYIVESTEPNAFTTGSDPEHASLAVSRGLLQLLNERELSAVVAHELSHIGNHDTDFSTMLAALVAILRLPLSVVTGMARLISLFLQEPMGIAVAVLIVFLYMFIWLIDSGSPFWNDVLGVGWNLRAIVVGPLYALILAPGCATLLRRTMSQQRDFLADADAALLTRDPEGLALALAKVGAAISFTPNADPATAHLYFVDPLPHTSWFDSGYPSHRPIDARIAFLARMGAGIAGSNLHDASQAGIDYRLNPPLVGTAPQPTSPRIVGRDSDTCTLGTQLRLTDPHTPLYKSADQSSAVLADLDADVLVTVVDLDDQFIHVRLVHGPVGYIRRSAGLKPLDDDGAGNQNAGAENLNGILGIHYRPLSSSVVDEHAVHKTSFRLSGTQFRLTDQNTPLYATPDRWSDVVQQLASGTIVTFNERVGGFARVAIDRTVGYIATGASVVRISSK
jgi:heat shock protein HtpX